MRRTTLGALALVTALIGAAGCATKQEIATWRENPTHFASGAHARFSLRNDMSSRPEVTRTDLSHASVENWWGDPVTVNADQIVSR
jgi:hypothetical protein